MMGVKRTTMVLSQRLETKGYALLFIPSFLRKRNLLEHVSRPQLADFQSQASCDIVANNILVASVALLHYRFSEMQKIRFVLSFYFRN